MLIPILSPKITVIIENSLLVTVQQVSGEHDVLDVGRHGVDSVDQPESVISAELPLVLFLGLMHFRISLALYIFGGAGRRNDDGVHNPVFTQHQAIFLPVLAHFSEQHRAEAVMRQEMAELDDCGFVRRTIQLQSGELAHGFNLVQCTFHDRVAVVIAQLRVVNLKCGGQRIGCSTSLTLGIIRGCFPLQLFLGNQFLRSFQKRFAAGFAILGLVLGLGEGDLIHSGTGSYVVDDARIVTNFEIYSEPLDFCIPPTKKIRMNIFAQKKHDLIQPLNPVKRRKIFPELDCENSTF